MSYCSRSSFVPFPLQMKGTTPKALGRRMLVGLSLCLRRGETRAGLFALHGVFHAFILAPSTPAQRPRHLRRQVPCRPSSHLGSGHGCCNLGHRAFDDGVRKHLRICISYFVGGYVAESHGRSIIFLATEFCVGSSWATFLFVRYPF